METTPYVKLKKFVRNINKILENSLTFHPEIDHERLCGLCRDLTLVRPGVPGLHPADGEDEPIERATVRS